MKKGGGKAKGSAFERRVADLFTAQYYPDGDGTFVRVISRPIPKKGDVRGDLKPLKRVGPVENVDPERGLVFDDSFPFIVECKHWRKVRPIFSGLYTNPSEMWDWMDQAADVAGREHRMPIVVFRLYRTDIIAMMRRQDFSKMQEMFGLFGSPYYVISQSICGAHELFKKIILFRLEDFFKWIDWGVYKMTNMSKYIRSLVPKE